MEIIKYVDIQAEPLYSFGDGLSYTSFKYKNININKKKITMEDLNKEIRLKLILKLRIIGAGYGCEFHNYIFLIWKLALLGELRNSRDLRKYGLILVKAEKMHH